MRRPHWEEDESIDARREREGKGVKNAVDVIYLAEKDVNALRYVSPVFLSDTQLMHGIVQKHPMALYYAEENVRRNRSIVLSGLHRDGRILAYASEEIQCEKRLVLHAISMNRGFNKGLSLNNVHSSLKDDDAVVRAAVEAHPSNYGFTSLRWRDDTNMTRSAVQRDGSQLYFASDRLRADWDTVREACEGQDAEFFKYAHRDVRNDRSLVIRYAAMHLRGNPLEYVHERFLRDEDVVSTAVRRDWRRLSHLHTHFSDHTTCVARLETPDQPDIGVALTPCVAVAAYENFVSKKCHNKIYELSWMLPRSLKDVDTVRRLVAIDPVVFKVINMERIGAQLFLDNPSMHTYISRPEVKRVIISHSRDHALAAVQHAGELLEFCGGYRHNDAEVVHTALRRCGSALKFAGIWFREHEISVRIAIQSCPSALPHAHINLRRNPAFMQWAISVRPRNAQFITRTLRDSLDFTKQIMEIIPVHLHRYLNRYHVASVQMEFVMRMLLPEDMLRCICDYLYVPPREKTTPTPRNVYRPTIPEIQVVESSSESEEEIDYGYGLGYESGDY